MAKHMNRELFKLDLIKELDDLSAVEMEDVLKYILLVKNMRKCKIPRYTKTAFEEGGDNINV